MENTQNFNIVVLKVNIFGQGNDMIKIPRGECKRLLGKKRSELGSDGRMIEETANKSWDWENLTAGQRYAKEFMAKYSTFLGLKTS